MMFKFSYAVVLLLMIASLSVAGESTSPIPSQPDKVDIFQDVRKKMKSEFERTRRLAEQGDAQAQSKLGYIYLYGMLDVDRDYQQALQWYRKAAEQGYPAAQFGLSKMYRDGIGVDQDNEQALYWRRKMSDAQEQAAREAAKRAPGVPSRPDKVDIFQDARKRRKSEFEQTRRLAEQGDAQAQSSLGYIYSNGIVGVVAQDYQQALQWYRKAAEQGYPAAQFGLSKMYRDGIGVDQDNEQALYWRRKMSDAQEQAAREAAKRAPGVPSRSDKINATREAMKAAKSEFEQTQRLAEQGDAQAQSRLGYIYLNGIEGVVAQSYQQALQWYHKAAEQGYPAAQFVESEFARTRRLAEQGDAQAQSSLGYIYSNGIVGVVAQDYQQALQWYRKAAEQGHFAAQFSLSEMYCNGIGVDRDKEQAVYWHRKMSDAQEQAAREAAKRAPGMVLVRFVFDECKDDVAQDEPQTLPWLLKAAEQGDAEAQFNLGERYRQGEGVDRDYQQAFQWYRKAAEKGHTEAQFNLGERYRQGEGVARDYQQAFQWYRKAAEQGHAEAQFNLGVRGTYGRQALQWLRKAADQGFAPAQSRLGEMYFSGNGIVQDYQQALQWYRKAAEQGHAGAQLNLGMMYWDGQGVVQDRRQASQWFRKMRSGEASD